MAYVHPSFTQSVFNPVSQSKVTISLTNHIELSQSKEPIKKQSKYMREIVTTGFRSNKEDDKVTRLVFV